MSYFCICGPILGPNEPCQLFSHHILCPMGPMMKKNCDTLPLSTGSGPGERWLLERGFWPRAELRTKGEDRQAAGKGWVSHIVEVACRITRRRVSAPLRWSRLVLIIPIRGQRTRPMPSTCASLPSPERFASCSCFLLKNTFKVQRLCDITDVKTYGKLLYCDKRGFKL